MPEESTPAATPPNTPDEAANNTGQPGTQPAQPEAQPEKTFTQADVDRMFQTRLKSAVKAELKKLTGETDGTPTVDELQRQLSETKTKAQAIEARESVRDYLADPVHKLNVKSENIAAIVKLVVPELEYDDDGKPSNLKEAVNAARIIAPPLFANTPGHINANEGRTNPTSIGGMNGMIRLGAGRG